MNRLALKPQSWIPEPSRHVLANCLPALPSFDGSKWYHHSWRYSRGAVMTHDVKNLSKKTVATPAEVDDELRHLCRIMAD